MTPVTFSEIKNLLKGACGSPDCRTFAKDIIDGRARLEECVCQQN